MWYVRERQREEELNRKNREKEEELKRINREKGIQEKTEEHYEFKISTWDRLLHNKLVRGVILVIVAAVIIPVFLFLFLDMQEKEFDEEHTCGIVEGYRVPCGFNVTDRKSCSGIDCCFDDNELFCFHFLPSKYLYKADNWTNGEYFIPTAEKTPFGSESVKKVYLTLKEISSTTLSIRLHEFVTRKAHVRAFSDAVYNVTVFTEEMGVLVKRLNNDTLLSTTHGPTIVSDRYWEWTVDLNTDYLFGMGELLVAENATTTKVFYKNAEDHTSIARFMAYTNGMFHGLQVDYNGPLEVTVLPAKLIVLRVLSGHEVTLTLTTGPTPSDVMRQQRGERSVPMPPYWGLGVHLCRDGKYESIEKVILEVDEVLTAQTPIPYDSDCIHENIFSLTMSAATEEMGKLADIVARVKSKKHFMMSLAPQISTNHNLYDQAEKLKILYTADGKKPTIGTYLKESVAYPDYSLDKTTSIVRDWYTSLPFTADGIVLRSNWPENEKYEMENSTGFQYLPENVRAAMSRTLPWNSRSGGGQQHILAHNSYGLEFTQLSASIIGADFLLTATPSADYAAHVQNVNASWVSYKRMLTQTLSHSLFGGTLYSVPVCGSSSTYNEKLNHAVCIRWYLTAATMPLFRISSDLPRRDPFHFQSKYLENKARDAIQIRYTLLPYYYTILSEGLPIVRPMFVDFYTDNNTLALDEQYMVGRALLVAQPTLFPISNVRVYMPEISGGWYEFWGGQKISQNGWITVPIVESDLIMFIAAGHVIPMQHRGSTSAAESRMQPLRIAVALNCFAGTCEASGKLHVSDAFDLVFTADENTLQISNILNDKLCSKFMLTTLSANIAVVQVYGLAENQEAKLYYPDVDLCSMATTNYTISFE